MKPRIYFERGYWRVSAMPTNVLRARDFLGLGKLWVQANNFTARLNSQLTR